MSKGERRLVEWLAARFRATAERVPIGIGDDMAAVRLGGGEVLLTADMLMDGVDFHTEEHSPQIIGRKALACSLSDCAAMAVRPVAAIVSLALPNAWSMEQAQALYAGMEPLAREFDVNIVGGDTNSWDGKLVIDVCIAAEAWPGLAPVRRDGARVGDLICISGQLGGSILGHHLSFDPRVRLARDLRMQLGGDLHAMMDISDGVLLDLARMCEASGVGAELDAARLSQMASADARTAASSDGRSVLDHVLADGEDFELLCAVAAHRAERITNESDHTLWSGEPVGRFVERGLWLVHADGRREPVEPRGWEHFK